MRVRIEVIISTGFIIIAVAIDKGDVWFSHGEIFSSFINGDDRIVVIGAFGGGFLVVGVLEAYLGSFEFIRRVRRGLSCVAAFAATHFFNDGDLGFVEESGGGGLLGFL